MANTVELGSPLNNITLPCGHFVGIGDTYHFSRSTTIKGMTGKVITQIGSKKVQSNPSLFMSLILEQCLVSVGDRKLRPIEMDNLLVADQDFIILKIRQLSKGDTVNGEIKCANCQEKIESKIDLNEIEITKLEEPTEEEMKLGYRVFEYKNEELGVLAKFRYPRVGDGLAVAAIAKENPISAHNRMVEMCLVSYEWMGEKTEGPFKKGFLEDLPVRNYESVRDGFLSNQPGVELQVNVTCWACTHVNKMDVTAQDFLLSPPKK